MAVGPSACEDGKPAGTGRCPAASLREIIATLKNHPSVFMWSVSNENHTKMVSERQGTPEMVKMTAEGNIELVRLAQSLDPHAAGCRSQQLLAR